MDKSIIKKAWITERAARFAESGKYVFVIDRKANKTEAVKAIEAVYNVKVTKANVLNAKSKEKRLGRSIGRTSPFKKVVVTLKKGQSIDIIPA